MTPPDAAHSTQPAAAPRRATLYRMVYDKHLCPWGLKAKDLLERKGYKVQDHHLRTRGEVAARRAIRRVGVGAPLTGDAIDHAPHTDLAQRGQLTRRERPSARLVLQARWKESMLG